MAASTSRSIPSLDGLRAASVAVVIVGHSLAYLHGEANRFPYLQLSELGQSGVDAFFVISGFLITYLLLKEKDATGTISLRNFYFRRFFRIFPPFYAYLAVVGILWVAGLARQDVRAFLSAATYTWNYAPHATSWLLAHTWSLSLEEQFYEEITFICHRDRSLRSDHGMPNDLNWCEYSVSEGSATATSRIQMEDRNHAQTAGTRKCIA